ISLMFYLVVVGLVCMVNFLVAYSMYESRKTCAKDKMIKDSMKAESKNS
uniref:Clarin-3 n=1 Tax=Haemonchus contortus TaxID=6289 RepID=A0A7I4YTC0_HAECO